MKTSDKKDTFFEGFKTVCFKSGDGADRYGISPQDKITIGLSNDKQSIRIKVENTILPYNDMKKDCIFEVKRSDHLGGIFNELENIVKGD